MATASNPPWGSKGVLNRIGSAIRDTGKLSIEQLYAFEAWRYGHSHILNTFKPLLWSRTKDKDIIVAQRLKRRHTIFDKLIREPKMELARMDDGAGCRLIFKDIASLESFRADFHKSKFKHTLRHIDDKDKYNYIKKPKDSGYRGVHDIYVYNVATVGGKKYNGLYIEMQFRTLCQHAWATAVEVVGRLTENQPKFNRGDNRHREFFRLASEILARTAECRTSCCESLSDRELRERFLALDYEIGVMKILKNVEIIETASSATKNNIVLHLSKVGKLEIYKYKDVESATTGYFDIEKKFPEDDIVLVRAKSFDAIRSAYRNYFQNTNEFVRLIEEGLALLAQQLSDQSTDD